MSRFTVNEKEGYSPQYSLEDYLEYRKILADCSSQERSDVIFNDSYVHAALVLTSILEYMMKQETKEISMYCGKFALFRDSAKNAITNLRAMVKPADDDTLKMEKWRDFDPYETMLAKFDEFMKEGGTMRVIIENDISDIKSEYVWEKLEKHIKSERLCFWRLTVPLRLNHFIVAGKSYRQENDDLEKTAICCFNDDITCKALKKRYQILELMSETYKF